MFSVLFDKVPSRPYWKKVLSTSRSNLLAYWPLWEASGVTAVDRSGNGRNGTYSGPTLGQAGIGDGRTSALFDGVNDVTNVHGASFVAAFNGSEGTLATWARVSAAGVWSDGSNHHIFNLAVNGSNVVVGFKNTGGSLALQYIAGGTAKTFTLVTTTTLWFHLTITWSKSADQAKFYFNGTQNGATQTGLGTWAGSLAATTTVLGATNTTPASVWSGYLAHCAVWDTPLNATQIAKLAVVS